MNLEDRVRDAYALVDELGPAVAPPLHHSAHRPVRRRALLLAVPLAVAASVTAGVVVGIGPAENDHVGPQPPTLRLAAASEMLEKAARSVEMQPGPAAVPEPKQWLHWTYFEYQDGSGTKTMEIWERFDGSQSASSENGKLVVLPKEAVRPGDGGTPLGAYRVLAKLPTDPQAMLTTLYRKVGSEPRGSGVTGDGLAFENIEQLLWNSPVSPPPHVQAAMYRALARIPGVKVRTSVEYAPGRTAIGIYHPSSHNPNASRAALLLDPATYRMIGMLSSTGLSMTRSKATPVASPGQR